jgi:hypothetical protein
MRNVLVGLAEIGTQIGWAYKTRITIASVSALESMVEMEAQINDLADLNAAWTKLGSIETRKNVSKDLEPVIFESTHWQVFCVL